MALKDDFNLLKSEVSKMAKAEEVKQVITDL